MYISLIFLGKFSIPILRVGKTKFRKLILSINNPSFYFKSLIHYHCNASRNQKFFAQ